SPDARRTLRGEVLGSERPAQSIQIGNQVRLEFQARQGPAIVQLVFDPAVIVKKHNMKNNVVVIKIAPMTMGPPSAGVEMQFHIAAKPFAADHQTRILEIRTGGTVQSSDVLDTQ